MNFFQTNFNAHLLPALGVIRNLQRVVRVCSLVSPFQEDPQHAPHKKTENERKAAERGAKVMRKNFHLNFFTCDGMASGLRRRTGRTGRQFPITVAYICAPLDITACLPAGTQGQRRRCRRQT